jgi:putative YphP/YqiW family bacilliredoxin
MHPGPTADAGLAGSSLESEETMPYDPELVQPMRDELTRLGVKELRTAEEVDEVLAPRKGSVLLVVNSVCGCAAGNARPGVALALRHPVLPDRIASVFAGQDLDATAHARSYLHGYEPSSPNIILFRDGEVVTMFERRHIEGRMPEEIAAGLTEAFDRYCSVRA